MTKTLTEKWKDMDLFDEHLYYWRMPNGEVRIMTKTGVYSYKLCYDGGEIDILVPVPSYEEYKRLQEKLEIAKASDESAHIRLYNERGETQKIKQQLKEANELITLLYPLSMNKERALERTAEYMEKWGVK